MAESLPNSAETLWTRGAGLLRGAKVLVQVAQQEFGDTEQGKQLVFNGEYSAAIHLLIGFSFELLLKAAYLCRGGSSDDVLDVRHDLVKALNLAEASGCRFTHPKLRWVVTRLRDPHMKHAFRYGWQSELVMPELDETLPVLESLADEVHLNLPI